MTLSEPAFDSLSLPSNKLVVVFIKPNFVSVVSIKLVIAVLVSEFGGGSKRGRKSGISAGQQGSQPRRVAADTELICKSVTQFLAYNGGFVGKS